MMARNQGNTRSASQAMPASGLSARSQRPERSAAISAAAVNLPFGKQIGSPAENRALYPAFLREMARVLRPGARLVALSGDRAGFTESLRRASKLARRETFPVMVLGQPASVYVIERA